VNVRGKRVVVLGAGDTAMDTLRIAIRNGALDVLCVCRRDAANSSADQEEYEDAVEEGARFEYLTKAIALRGDAAGNVIGVRCVRMVLGEPDLTGRLTVQPLPDSEFDLPADAVFVAYGFAPPKLPQTDDFALLTLDGRGCLLVDQHGMTNLPGVFAGGSIVRGSVSLCHVVLDSRSVAVAIDRYLAATPARA
jgi:glutamate synthase (NADPH/NADH) small chain